MRLPCTGAGFLVAALIAAGCAERPRRAAVSPPAVTNATFTFTAYCTGTRTATGTRPNEATIAADPAVLPMGTRVRVSGLRQPYDRVYTVGDTGGKIRGRRIDLYMRNCTEAKNFGRRSASVAVLQ